MNLERPENTRFMLGQQLVEEFLWQFDGNEEYRVLACHAALPLALTPELLKFLRHEFLPHLSWVAEVDLLLSHLCAEAAEDVYVMQRDARAFLIKQMRQDPALGVARIEAVNRLLIDHLDFLSRNHPALLPQEWETQRLSAMLFVTDKRDAAARELSEAIYQCLSGTGAGSNATSAQVKAELTRLTRMVREAADDLNAKEYEELVQLAQLTGKILADRSGTYIEQLRAEGELERAFKLPSVAVLISSEELAFKLESIKHSKSLPLNSALNSITESFPEQDLKQLDQASERVSSLRLWEAKLFLAGDGGAGKTSLLRRLTSNSFDPNQEVTHGLAINTLLLPHPSLEDVAMKLEAWDLGGQAIYHGLYHLCLTDQSIYLVVRNARRGEESGRLTYWLETITTIVPRSPIILVATFLDERSDVLPLLELQRRYPQVVGYAQVSNKTGEGISSLQKLLAQTSATLPSMGQEWPMNWANVRYAIRDIAAKQNYITKNELTGLFEEYEVTDSQRHLLTNLLHDYGDILYFQDDNELNGFVILNYHWLSELISRVLESYDVRARLGIFTRENMDQLWRDLPSPIREHCLILMEHFGLSFRILENKDVSLVVECLPYDPPDYKQQWESQKEGVVGREIKMSFKLDQSLPAGIPGWFIARSARFSLNMHWRYGALLGDDPKLPKHLGLVEAFLFDRCVLLTVRGPAPQNFFALLRDGLESMFNRFPNLNVSRSVPCYGKSNIPCSNEFDLLVLERSLEVGQTIVTCPKCVERKSIAELLLGIKDEINEQQLAPPLHLTWRSDEKLVPPPGLTDIVALFDFETLTLDARGQEIKNSRRTLTARQFVEDLGQGVGLEMVEISGGKFLMGTNEKDKGREKKEIARYWDKDSAERWVNRELPQREVNLESFYIGKFTITQQQWRTVAGWEKVERDLDPNPSHFKDKKDSDDRPVEQVSWEDAQEFCARLSQKTGRAYRLPSEAEWEYACRAGTATPFAFGETITHEVVNYDSQRPYAKGKKLPSRKETIPVGSLGVANAFGVFDMHGNVWEWCEDVWHQNYEDAPMDGSAWLSGGDSSSRVLRGGSWNNSGNYCRSALRDDYQPGGRNDSVGFRVVVSARTSFPRPLNT